MQNRQRLLVNRAGTKAVRAITRIGFTVVLYVLLGAMRPPSAWAGGHVIDGVLNLNTAPIELLTLLPGIGPSKAKAILAYRLRRPFRTVDELVRIKGIGRRMVREIRPHLAVAGPSTARAVRGVSSTPVSPVPSPPGPPGPPAPPRLACRVVLPAGSRSTVAQRRNGVRLPFDRSPANHCRRPS